MTGDGARWMAAAMARHTHDLPAPQFLKAVRALSARYVEHRDALRSRSPIDSAGKRAAFAGFYAPIHYLTARAIVHALDSPAPPVSTLLDLGCGTGAVSAAWASALPDAPDLIGIDRDARLLAETDWTWRQFGWRGRTRRADLVDAAARAASGRDRHRAPLGIVLGWSVNELDDPARDALLTHLQLLMAQGAAVLVIEPVSGAAVPWWDTWTDVWEQAGGRADLWTFPADMPARLSRLSADAGFRRDRLTARSLWHRPIR